MPKGTVVPPVATPPDFPNFYCYLEEQFLDEPKGALESAFYWGDKGDPRSFGDPRSYLTRLPYKNGVHHVSIDTRKFAYAVTGRPSSIDDGSAKFVISDKANIKVGEELLTRGQTLVIYQKKPHNA